MRWVRRFLPLLLTAAVLAPVAQGTPVASAQRDSVPVAATTDWRRQIDALVGDLPVSVEIGYAGKVLYHHLEWVPRTPASNEKLLVSMALLERLSPDTTIPTRVLTGTPPVGGVVHGNLWIVGHGNPETGKPDMAALADALKADGITRVRGSVIASTGPFARDWWANGWRWYFPLYYMPLPTALTFDGNTLRGAVNPNDPERAAAISLTHKLRARGVAVHGAPRIGRPSTKLTVLATIHSLTLRSILHRTDLWSINFYAEVLGKYLGAEAYGEPGTIAKGAAAVRAFAAAHGVHNLVVNDGSGLSYADRVTASDIVKLLWVADASPWGVTLRNLLATGGHGTLLGRLQQVPVHAKTGTLIGISALSGWVWLAKKDAWAEFSILSRGMPKDRSVHIENSIVRLVSTVADPGV